jgi:tetratricopeptide (TPR) repeat protein
VLSAPAFSSPSVQDIVEGIHQSLNQDYENALAQFDSIKQNYPHHPAGYLFTAAVLQTRMTDMETSRWLKEFYDQIDRAITLADSLPPNPEAEIPLTFYLGAGLSYKSIQQGRQGHYLSAIKLGLQAIDKMKSVAQTHPDFCDPHVAIGTFLYWKSRLVRLFSWLPFVSDQRKEGIEQIRHSIPCSIFSRWAGLSNLSWIYIHEKKYNLAISTALDGLETFPQSRFFLWPLAEAQFRKGNYQRARISFQRILGSLATESPNNHYNEIVLYWKLAQCHHHLGDEDKTRMALYNLVELKPAPAVRERAQEKQEKARKWLDELEDRLYYGE